MQIGLIGLPQSGKRTLFHLLTGVVPPPDAAATGAATPGICAVRDPRIETLVGLYHPRKTTPATIQYLLLPDLTKDSKKNEELLRELIHVDVLGCVVRAFEDGRVFHLEGSVDPLRDIETIQSELVLHDLLFLETRLSRIAKEKTKPGKVDRSAEEALFSRCQEHLNQGAPLRTLAITAEEEKLFSGASLLTRKPLLLIVNVHENHVRDQSLLARVHEACQARAVHVVQVSAKIEEELAQLEDPAERTAFLKELGITESALDGLTRVSYEALGLISYFTVGEDEVRAWTVRRGATAPQAGGAIHTDIERGFIRAERMAYQDLVALRSEKAVAEAGKASLKGKEYVVADGDILNFRFQV